MLLNVFSDQAAVSFCSGRDESLGDAKALSQFASLPFIEMEQVHGARLQTITSPLPQVALGADAIITSLPGVALVVRTADCLPVLIYRPEVNGNPAMVGAVHAGRKSSEQGLLGKVLSTIKRKYPKHTHGDAKGLQIWFGPAICQNCYQINRETDLHYDLIGENLKQVLEVFGPSEAQVKQSKICTVCENSQWYSYRQEGVGVKMNYSGIALRLG
jgi:copper oxidase (laccase) domain-containing protein